MIKKIINSTEDFLEIKSEWERIQNQPNNLYYFSSFEYCYTWWEANCNNISNKLFIIVVINNNKIVGIAPLIFVNKKKSKTKYTSLEFLAQGDENDFLIDNDTDSSISTIIKELIKEIELNNEKWDVLNLTHINQNSELTSYLLKSKYNNNFNYLIENPHIDFKEFKNFKSYSHFIPKNILRYSKKLKRQTNYSFVIKTDDVFNKISKIHLMEKEYLKSKGREERHSIFDLPYSEKFKFLESLYSKSKYLLTFLLIDNSNDEIISYYTGYLFKNKYLYWSTGYNPQYEKLIPSRVLKYEIIKYFFENEPTVKFDFGSGRYAWKFEWTNRFSLMYRLYYMNPKAKKLLWAEKISSIKKILF
ncbi:GNAT family N-acetyltransferase [Lentimicrobium sp. S6]|uniref:GNAT family N-acetyltransferase n=1 Tax=Lentimicrobium sp. S6 TaxID=2735872 RepID=UPI001555BE73|nr:GNAT family N-acetyltransferase [Lentimicrobium sp. S6]NPD46735.1 GNAT family N-acetyltransferase [Lentimicrobium sp. S6]